MLEKLEAEDAVERGVVERQLLGDVTANERQPGVARSVGIDLAQVEARVVDPLGNDPPLRSIGVVLKTRLTTEATTRLR